MFLECQRLILFRTSMLSWWLRHSSLLKTKICLWWLQEERENLAKSETFAIRISNIANMVLFAAKVYASIRSGSLAIIASTLDSLLDLLSGFILWFTAFSMQTPNPYQYPIGKKRMQPLVSSLATSSLYYLTWWEKWSYRYRFILPQAHLQQCETTSFITGLCETCVSPVALFFPQYGN